MNDIRLHALWAACLAAGCVSAPAEGRSGAIDQAIEAIGTELLTYGPFDMAREDAWYTTVVDVPEHTKLLQVSIDGANGDADLYVRFGEAPTEYKHDCAPWTWGSVETCAFDAPAPGPYYIAVDAYSAFAGVTLTVNYELEPAPEEIADAIDEAGLSATRGQALRFPIAVDDGAERLQVTITGGTGDADIYVKHGSSTTLRSEAACAPYKAGNEERCDIESPDPGTWYVTVHAYSSFADVQLTATVEMPPPPAEDLCAFTPATAPILYGSEARRVVLDEVDAGYTTFYCGCSFSYEARTVDHDSCGYRPNHEEPTRAGQVELEHIVPASRMSEGRACRNQCSGQNVSSRKCCRINDAEFAAMEGDLHNLYPSVGQVNAVRSSKDFGSIPGELRTFGACDFEYNQTTVEPADHLRGDVARVYLYMDAQYEGFSLTPTERSLFETWHELDPVDQAEHDRNLRVKAIQGNANPYALLDCDL